MTDKYLIDDHIETKKFFFLNHAHYFQHFFFNIFFLLQNKICGEWTQVFVFLFVAHI